MKKLVLLSLFVLFSLNTIFALAAQDSLFQQLMDSIVLANMEAHQVPGLSYAIVRADKTTALNAHGFADLETKQAMQINSKFMLGSLSKLFVSTAVMQLVERGKLDLKKDVSEYLGNPKIKVRANLHQLLTHTAGFEERTFDRIRLEANEVMRLEEFLEKNMPSQVFAPGKIGAYSNYGMALAGLVVEKVSGMSFEEFVQENIFTPLEMNQASFEISAIDEKELATPYLIKNGQLVRTHYEYVLTRPASMLTGDAEDMAHFMIAHLNGGKFGQHQILKKEMLSTLQSQQFTHHPELDGRAYGFFEKSFRGRRSLDHGNTRNGFVSYMYLVPEDSLGIFVTINGGRGSFRAKVVNDFLKAIYPEIEIEVPKKNAQTISLDQYRGKYYSTRANKTGIERIFHQLLLDRFIKVENAGDTALVIFGDHYKLTGENYVTNSRGSHTVAFGIENGQSKFMYLPGRSDAYQKLPWYSEKIIALPILVVATLVFLITLIVSFVKILRKKTLLSKTIIESQFLYSLFGFGFMASFAITIGILQEAIQYGIPNYFYVIFTLPILCLFVFPTLIYQTWKKWNIFSSRQKLGNITFATISTLFVWQLFYWNFIGYCF